MTKKRPSFRKPKAQQAYSSPEELFANLSNRSNSHGYLRAPQVDALRDYEKMQNESDIAFELPTGTGKTLVGLLIAEWRRRRTGAKVTYLALTNQLAKQVIREAEKLGIDCADIAGSRDTREPAEIGKYKAAQAIGITTYSNLFNVNPVVQASDVIVFDDAHGGEQFVADMWTVKVRKQEYSEVHNDLLTILRPVLTDSQYRIITDESEFGSVELANAHGNSALISEIIEIIDKVNNSELYFPWSMIRNNLNACFIFVSLNEIVIRPLIPPTHTHEPFSGTNQRIYMSATLGGEGDLLRGYGVTSIKPIRVQHVQWGKRYIFIPGLYLEENKCRTIISNIWQDIPQKRALMLTPSFSISEKAFQDITQEMDPNPGRLNANDIAKSLDPFILADNAILCLAGRYDGIDLPGDNCRLLLLIESPAAIGALERHLRGRWRLGPLLRRRERVRLVQGMGRCTRDATDYAIILLIGQSLIDSLTTPLLVQGLPGEIQREIKWGIEQSKVALNDIKEMSRMIIELLSDKNYRKDANESIGETELPETKIDSESYDDSGKLEVRYSKALWEENYSTAFRIAHEAADKTVEPELTGYCAWWLYLGAIAARYQNNRDGEIDCIKRARATGINTGFLDHILRGLLGKVPEDVPSSKEDRQAEAIWRQFEKWGWRGPKFNEKMKDIKEGLSALTNPTRYHLGLEGLGQCLGAEVLRPTEEGAPDVVWIFSDNCFTFEVKSKKKTDGSLSKKDIQQTKGHPNWIREHFDSYKHATMYAIVVSPTRNIDAVAEPHARDVYYVSTDTIAEFANHVISEVSEIRTSFAGKEFGAVLNELKSSIIQAKINCDTIRKLLCKSQLKTSES